MKKRFEVINKLGLPVVVAWGKLFDAELAKSFKFPVGKIHEDEFTVHKWLLNAQSIVYVNSPVCYYLKRSGSITNSSFNEKRMCAIEALKERLEFYQRNNVDEKYVGQTVGNLLSAIINLYFKAEQNKGIQNNLLEEYRKISKEHKNLFKHIKFKSKLKFFMFKYCPKVLSKMV